MQTEEISTEDPKFITVSGKIGQETVDKKLTGGKFIKLSIPKEEADKLVMAIFEAYPDKLKSMLYDYGITADTAKELDYRHPGAVPIGENFDAEKVPVTNWNAADTKNYLSALEKLKARKKVGKKLSEEEKAKRKLNAAAQLPLDQLLALVQAMQAKA